MNINVKKQRGKQQRNFFLILNATVVIVFDSRKLDAIKKGL